VTSAPKVDWLFGSAAAQEASSEPGAASPVMPVPSTEPAVHSPALSVDVPEVQVAVPEPPPAMRTDRTIINLGSQADVVTFTFQEAPWPEVLSEFAQWAGLTLDLTDTPPGYFSYFDSRSHSPAEAIDILNGYLLPRGFVLLRRDRFLVTLKTDNAMLDNLVPTVAVGELDDRGDNELVRIVVELDEISPEVAAVEIRDLLGPYGEVTPLESSRSIVLRGFGGPLRQALEVLGKSKPAITDDKLDFRSYSLVHLPAAEAEQQIRTLFGISSSNRAVNVSGAREELDRANYYRNREQNERDGKSRDSVPPPIPLLKQVAMNMQVSSLERNNNLLVTATPEGLLLVESILKSIDVAQGNEGQRWVSDTNPVLRVYNLDSADEGEVAKTLDVLMPGIVVNEDRRQDTIHVFATAKQHEEAGRLISQLDQGEGGSRVVEVIPLRYVNPLAAADLLQRLFENEDRDTRPTIQAELPSRTIVVRGTSSQVGQVRDALTGLGEPVSSQPTASVDRVRRIAVGGRSAEAIANAAERILSGDKQFRSSIRVVVPGQTRAKSPGETQSKSARVIEESSHNSSLPRKSGFTTVALTNLAVGSEGIAKDKKTPPVDAKQTRPSVSIEVRGDELMVYSGDPESLDDVEGMIRELMLQMPDRTRWTVFYLRVAEAELAAQKLLDLTQNPSSLLNGIGSYSDEVPLRIVADKRTNAIFVSGPQERVEEVEGFLDYIDASDVPGSFLRRQPHAIVVQYADVNEVAELLRNLYKDFLVDPVAERLKLESSRRSSSRDSDDSSSRSSSSSTANTSKTEGPGIRLTLAVDNKTGELLVACSDQLFEEIEAVVKQRDQAVRDSKPTVQFIPITSATPGNLVDLLQGISPRVTAEAILPVVSSATDDNRNRSSRSSSDRNRGR